MSGIDHCQPLRCGINSCMVVNVSCNIDLGALFQRIRNHAFSAACTYRCCFYHLFRLTIKPYVIQGQRLLYIKSTFFKAHWFRKFSHASEPLRPLLCFCCHRKNLTFFQFQIIRAEFCHSHYIIIGVHGKIRNIMADQ